MGDKPRIVQVKDVEGRIEYQEKPRVESAPHENLSRDVPREVMHEPGFRENLREKVHGLERGVEEKIEHFKHEAVEEARGEVQRVREHFGKKPELSLEEKEKQVTEKLALQEREHAVKNAEFSYKQKEREMRKTEFKEKPVVRAASALFRGMGMAAGGAAGFLGGGGMANRPRPTVAGSQSRPNPFAFGNPLASRGGGMFGGQPQQAAQPTEYKYTKVGGVLVAVPVHHKKPVQQNPFATFGGQKKSGGGNAFNIFTSSQPVAKRGGDVFSMMPGQNRKVVVRKNPFNILER